MTWLKDVLLDIAVTLLILSAVLFTDPWMIWLLWAYTGILLFAKAVILFGDSFLQLLNKTQTEAPEWFSHLLYAANTGLLIFGQRWYLASAWALIWLLSFLAERKRNRKIASS